MKFGKEFEAQMVPEWKEAYMDYSNLKTLLKSDQRYKQRRRQPATPRGVKRQLTLYSGLLQRHPHYSIDPCCEQDNESQPIMVNSVQRDGSERYQTTFLLAAEEGGEFEMIYFKKLDDEFNKVDKFYRSKVEEVMKEAAMLNKQMEALIAFRIKVQKPSQWFNSSVEMTRLASDVADSAAALSSSTPRGAKLHGRVNIAMQTINENSLRHGQPNDSSENKDLEIQLDGQNFQTDTEKEKDIMGTKLSPLVVLNQVRLNNTLETPCSTIKGFLNWYTQTELQFNRNNLKKVEEQLKRAFIEFYQKLRLLKNYSFLNTLAFLKIMKKYDKITSRCAAKAYLRMVDNSYLGSCDEVTRLMMRVEETFIKHFSNSNRDNGLNLLRPKPTRKRHRITFSTGFLAGCTAALALALTLIIHARDIMNHPGRIQYMETMFPLYSLFGFIVLHMFMYAANVYFWRRYKVNQPFIFGFKQGSELSYLDVLLLAFVLAASALASVLANLDMEMDPNTKDYKAFTELIPLILVLFVIAILSCPFNIMYRSSRLFFLTCVFHCICAPLYKVTLPDFFWADQFTSQVQALRSLEFYICYYGWGDFKHRQNTCNSNNIFITFSFVVAVIPYWCRLLQCLRRLFEEKDAMQGYNGLKYFLTIAAVCLRTAYSLDKGLTWEVLAWVFSICAAIFSTYWDIVMDWGLLQKSSKNRWLRDKLTIPHKSVYFTAMVLNILLRFAWLQTVLDFKVNFLHRQALISIIASLEIIRRGIWSFFRVENEHLNNVGKFRAFKSVPLPFNYDEDEGKDE